MKLLIFCFTGFLLFPISAQAYIGPGAGFGIIAVVAGTIGSVLLGLFAVLWYPIKRLLKKLRSTSTTVSSTGEDSAEQ